MNEIFDEQLYPGETLFFFQAEDGIRDADVTGVQTCALPIFSSRKTSSPSWYCLWVGMNRPRSEERRVGKECRSRWSPGESKKEHDFTEADGVTTVRTAVTYAPPAGREAVLRYQMARGSCGNG